GEVVGGRAELLARREVRESRLGPQVRDAEALLEAARGRDDLAEDRPHQVRGQRTPVRARQALEHTLLARRRVHLGVAARLLLGDRERELGASAEEAQQLVVDPVDLLPEDGNRGLAQHAAPGAWSSPRPGVLQTCNGRGAMWRQSGRATRASDDRACRALRLFRARAR